MARYEVAVSTHIRFHRREPPYTDAIVIKFEGRRFVWPGNSSRAGVEMWPTVTTVITDSDDYAAERLAMARLLSALSYRLGQPIDVVSAGGASVASELDRPSRAPNVAAARAFLIRPTTKSW
jgi:hypothetical protein